MIRIAFILPTMEVGGAEKVLSSIIAQIDKKKFEPILILLERRGPFLERIPPEVRIVELGHKRASKAFVAIISALRELRPDIVISSIFYLNIVVGIAMYFAGGSSKLIVRETTLPSKTKFLSSKLLQKFIARLAYRRASLLVCQSIAMAEDSSSFYRVPLTKIRVIGNPVEEHCELVETHRPNDVATSRKFKLLAMGRLNHLKNFHLLIRSFALLDKSLFSLLLVGEGEEESSLRQLVSDLQLTDSVEIAPFTLTPAVFMAEADALVLSSSSEGFPNVVVEALACGTPVVATSCNGVMKELVSDGFNGYVSLTDTPEELAGCIKSISATNVDREAIKNDVVTRFGMRKIIAVYETLFSELAKPK